MMQVCPIGYRHESVPESRTYGQLGRTDTRTARVWASARAHVSASQLGAGSPRSYPDEGWRITFRLPLKFWLAHYGDPLTAK
jgi:hypothetical protein